MSFTHLPDAVLTRILLMLSSFSDALIVNREWSQVVMRIRTDWMNGIHHRWSTVCPHARPSPRVCARVMDMDIDERYLAPMRQPKPLSLHYVLEDEEPMLTPLTESDILALIGT